MRSDCVWWEEEGLTWSTGGCERSQEREGRTECLCDHLTNFAIMFGEADPDHPVLDPLSVTLLSVSALAILLTQASLAFTR